MAKSDLLCCCGETKISYRVPYIISLGETIATLLQACSTGLPLFSFIPPTLLKQSVEVDFSHFQNTCFYNVTKVRIC